MAPTDNKTKSDTIWQSMLRWISILAVLSLVNVACKLHSYFALSKAVTFGMNDFTLLAIGGFSTMLVLVLTSAKNNS